MKDSNLRLIPPPGPNNSHITMTSTYTGPGVQWNGQANPWAGLSAQFDYKNALNTSGSNTVTVKLQESADNSTFTDFAAGTPVTLGQTANFGTIKIPVTSTKKYIRCVVTLAGGGAGATVDVSGAVATGAFPPALVV